MERDFSLDNPARRHEEDLFNRWPFSQRLANTIAGFDAHDGAPVIGLFAKWGYGKSTVLNFVCEALQADHAATVAVLSFNPWLFKDPETLLLAFFAELAETIKASLSTGGQQVAEVIARYAGALAAIPVVGGGAAKAVEALAKDVADNPIKAQRDTLTALMRQSARKVVVLIDDLDRLDRDEIMTMLKLVRLSANFPHVVYVLAFDDARVARVAGTAYGEAADGRQFLEKIIQYPFSLPAVGQQRLKAFVIRHARAACDAAGVRLRDGEWPEFDAICEATLLARLTTPRQAIRYANALRFALPLLAGEVDPFVQMLVEAMRVLFPELYAWARERPHPGSPYGPEIAARAMEPASPEEIAAGGGLVTELKRPREGGKPVFYNIRYRDRYFTYAVAPDDIADATMDALLALAQTGDQGAVDHAVVRLFTSKPAVLLERLTACAGGLTRRQAPALALALAAIGSGVRVCDSYQKTPQAHDAGELVAAILLDAPGPLEWRAALVGDMLARAEPLAFALVLEGEMSRGLLTRRTGGFRRDRTISTPAPGPPSVSRSPNALRRLRKTARPMRLAPPRMRGACCSIGTVGSRARSGPGSAGA